MATAYQVTTSSTTIYTPTEDGSGGEVTIQNLGPNPIYIDFGEAATVAGSLQIPANGGTYTTNGLQVINAICSVLQATPLDTRISIERVVN